VIRLQPDEGLSLNLMAKTPGDGMRLKQAELELDFREQFKTPRMEAYERLLLDVLRGQLTLFMRGDELEAAWEWVEPILDHWEQDDTCRCPTPPAPGARPRLRPDRPRRPAVARRSAAGRLRTSPVLLDSIRTQLDSLSKSERKVALAVLASPNGTVSQNITALARAAQVSEPTVVRFCRTLGYDGWHEFKLKLAQGLALALPGASEQPAQDDLAADLVNKICSRSINTLLDLRNNLKPELIQQALDILSRANKIEFYGQGTSGFVAADAQHKFFRSGVPTIAYTDPAIHSIAAALLREGDAVVAISQRGNNPALVRSAKLARRGGAEVIVLAPSGTPLADMASLLIDPIDLVLT
jgi:RpiR family carbohydrate utilization transcriptional regulator